MSKPPKRQKPKKAAVELQPELEQELEFILDRFKVQHPNGASLEGYLQTLRTTLMGKETLTAALLERIGRRPTEVGFRLLQTLQDLFPSKTFRKIYRQSEYRFRQAGFAVEATTAGAPPVVLVPGEVKPALAHMSALSPDGHWFVSALVPDGQQSRTLVFALLAFPFECLELRTMVSSLSDYREFQKELAHNFIHPYVNLPIRHAARVVLEVLESGARADVRREETVVRRLLKPFLEPERPHCQEELFPPLSGLATAVSDTEAQAVFQNLPPQALMFSKEELKPFYERIGALDHSVLIVNTAVKEDRARDITAEAADQLCGGAMRSALARFFEEQALYFHLLGQVDAALTLWKTAGQLGSSEPASRSPVILGLISASLYLHWHDEIPEADSQKPVQSQDPTYQTESGLILLR